MDWFTAWWNELGLLGQALACVAIPGTMLLVVQTILLLVGGAFGHDSDHGADFSHDHDSGFDHDGDTDFGHDHDLGFAHSSDGDFDDLHDMSHAESGIRVFTVRGIVAFLAVGGWTGLAVWENTRNPTGSIVSALLAGSAALVFAALVVKWALTLQEAGNMDPRNAIARLATVYIPVPPKRSITGRVTLMFQERFVEMDAVTDNEETLKTGETVQVVGLQGGATLVVKPVRKE